MRLRAMTMRGLWEEESRERKELDQESEKYQLKEGPTYGYVFVWKRKKRKKKKEGESGRAGV